MDKKYVAYYRVSTDWQADWYLTKQKAAVAQYLNGVSAEAEYTDISSGAGSSQVQLLYAVEHAHRIKGLLVVATKDRLSRYESFFVSLQARGIGYVCVDEVRNG